MTCLLSKHAVQSVIYQGKFLVQQNIFWIEEPKLTETHYGKSLLFQGGLEIPCEVTVSMLGSIKRHMLLQHYQNMVDELYCQPKEDVIKGSFIEKKVGNIEPVRAKKRKTVKKAEKPKEGKDIRNFFQKRRRNNQDDDDADVTPVTICID